MPGPAGEWQSTKEGIEYRFETVPNDPRFKGTDQARNCWQNYVDFFKCVNLFDGDESSPRCRQFKRAYQTLCPDDWVERWDANRLQGTSPFDFDPPEALKEQIRGERQQSE